VCDPGGDEKGIWKAKEIIEYAYDKKKHAVIVATQRHKMY
jgi:hypothetical protein